MSQAITKSWFEKVKPIRIKSASDKWEDAESEIFGGTIYSASVQIDYNAPTSINLDLVSKNGKFTSSEKLKEKLNVTQNGGYDIEIGNVSFYNFFLKGYSIEKRADSRVLRLEFVDESILLDKIFVGLLNKHFNGYSKGTRSAVTSFNCNNGLDGITCIDRVVEINYQCGLTGTSGSSGSNGRAGAALLKRPCKTVSTIYQNGVKKERLKHFLKYNYYSDSVNGGYIILGEEIFTETPCEIANVNYAFADLAKALMKTQIPGVFFDSNNSTFQTQESQNVYSRADNKEKLKISKLLHNNLRREYHGTLREVLAQWGNDLGVMFYYQPKIKIRTKDYSNDNTSIEKEIFVYQGLKMLDVREETGLSRLNALLETSEELKKVIEESSETASLEGTFNTSLVTCVNRAARTFNRSENNVAPIFVYPINAQAGGVKKFFGDAFYRPNYLDGPRFLTQAILSKYNETLRDLFLSQNAFSFDNEEERLNALMSLGIDPDTCFYLGENTSSNYLDALMGNASIDNLPAVNQNANHVYLIALVKYDEEKHKQIIKWEASYIDSFYGKYFQLNPFASESASCNLFSSYSEKIDTNPSSEIYSKSNLPFLDLMLKPFAINDANLGAIRLAKMETPIYLSPTSEVNLNKLTNEPTFSQYSPLFYKLEDSKTFHNLKSLLGPSWNSIRQQLALQGINITTSIEEIIQKCKDRFFTHLLVQKFPRFFENGKPTNKYVISTDVSVGVNPLVPVKATVSKTETNTTKECPNICSTSLFTCPGEIASSVSKKGEPYFQNQLVRSISLLGYYWNPGEINEQTGLRTYTEVNSGIITFLLPSINQLTMYRTLNLERGGTVPKLVEVIGAPPKQSGKQANVMSCQVDLIAPPESITLPSLFNPEGAKKVGEQVVIYGQDGELLAQAQSLYQFDSIMRSLPDGSLRVPHESKEIHLSSTFIPSVLTNLLQLKEGLAGISMQLNDSGVSTVLRFESRPKKMPPRETLYEVINYRPIFK